MQRIVERLNKRMCVTCSRAQSGTHRIASDDDDEDDDKVTYNAADFYPGENWTYFSNRHRYFSLKPLLTCSQVAFLSEVLETVTESYTK